MSTRNVRVPAAHAHYLLQAPADALPTQRTHRVLRRAGGPGGGAKPMLGIPRITAVERPLGLVLTL